MLERQERERLHDRFFPRTRDYFFELVKTHSFRWPVSISWTDTPGHIRMTDFQIIGEEPFNKIKKGASVSPLLPS